MNRTEAATAGLRTYNTGRPCRAGHTSDRYTSTGNCCECLRERQRQFSAAMIAGKAAGAGPLFTYRLHPDDHAAALAFCQGLDLQRGRPPAAAHPVAAASVRSATPEEVQAHRRRIFGDAADGTGAAPGPSTLTPEEFRRRYPNAG